MKQLREVRVLHLFTFLILPAIFFPLCIRGLNLLWEMDLTWPIRLLYCLPVALLAYVLLRRIAVGAVLAYKAFAPMSIRGECRFEPSCSTYMIMAINKYGLIVGIFKGIRRILRCHPPNGGVDYP